MIRILHTRRDERCTLEICGHAESADFGRDVVCAGVSAITTTLALLLRDENADVQVKSGNTRITYTAGKDIEAYITFSMTGYRWMAEVFPEFVTLQEKTEC